MFTVIPAIDLKEGRCVRLRQGRASEETVYSDDPVRMARYWEKEGAAWLHVVDLDGAFTGHPVHTALIMDMIAAVSIPVQVGGGVRSDLDIQRLVKGGAARVILGTRACQAAEPCPPVPEPGSCRPGSAGQGELAGLVKRFPNHLAVGIDAHQGRVQIKGWTETTSLDAVTLASRLDRQGVRTLIYTDTSRDGMLKGPNLPAIQAMCDQVSCQVIASGGVASAEDVVALRNLKKSNLVGVIVGKALYEGTVTLKELQNACGDAGSADKPG